MLLSPQINPVMQNLPASLLRALRPASPPEANLPNRPRYEKNCKGGSVFTESDGVNGCVGSGQSVAEGLIERAVRVEPGDAIARAGKDPVEFAADDHLPVALKRNAVNVRSRLTEVGTDIRIVEPAVREETRHSGDHFSAWRYLTATEEVIHDGNGEAKTVLITDTEPLGSKEKRFLRLRVKRWSDLGSTSP